MSPLPYQSRTSIHYLHTCPSRLWLPCFPQHSCVPFYPRFWELLLAKEQEQMSRMANRSATITFVHHCFFCRNCLLISLWLGYRTKNLIGKEIGYMNAQADWDAIKKKKKWSFGPLSPYCQGLLLMDGTQLYFNSPGWLRIPPHTYPLFSHR